MPGKIIKLNPNAQRRDGKPRYQDGKPRYRARWHSQYASRGERTYKYRVERTRTLAQRWLREMDRLDVLENENPALPVSQTMTFGELVDIWRGTRLAGLAPGSQTRYDQVLRTYLLPAWEHDRLMDLTREVVKRYFNELAHSTQPTTGKPMTQGTLRKIQIVASSVFSEGMDLEHCRTNPASRLRLAELYQGDEHEDIAALFLDPIEVHKLADAIPDYRVAILLAAYAGPRASELWALRIRDVDLENGRIHIRRALKRAHGQGKPADAPQFGKRKNGQPCVVRLPAFLTRELSEHIRSHSTPGVPDALVFTAPEGGIVRHELFMARRFRPAVRKVLPHKPIKFHELRHTAASLAIRNGATLEQVQERLGHKDARSTAIYSHLYEGHDDQFLAALDRAHTVPANVVPIKRASAGGA